MKERCTWGRQASGPNPRVETCGNEAIKFLKVNGKSTGSLAKHVYLKAYCKDHIHCFLPTLDIELTYDEYVIRKVIES